MIFLAAILTLLIIIIYFSRITLSKGMLSCVYLYFIGNMYYELIKKGVTNSSDYSNYLSAFSEIKNIEFRHIFELKIFEPIFRMIAWLLLHIVGEYTFVTIVLTINLLIAIGIYLFYADKNLAIFALVFYTYSPIFMPMSTNIVRQMLVISLIFIIFRLKSYIKLWVLILPFIHSSSIIILPIILLHRFIRLSVAIVLLGISILLFISGLNQKIFGGLSIFKQYTSQEFYQLSGFAGNRLDFLAFTLFIIFIGFILYRTTIISVRLMKYLLLTGTAFCLFGFQAFSDRIAIYNWCFLILLVPYLMLLIRRVVIKIQTE